jgi:hypothetical protein
VEELRCEGEPIQPEHGKVHDGACRRSCRFKLELAAGRAMDIFHATEPAGPEVYKHLFQAYLSVKPEGWRGLQFDFGKFVTSAGAEPTETHLNWNYSRSLLFANGPYYHLAYERLFHRQSLYGRFQLVNGWNNVETTIAETAGFTAAFTSANVFDSRCITLQRKDGHGF